MSRLASALRVRARQLDVLRLAIAAEQQHALTLSRAAADLVAQREAERRLAPSFSGLSSDAWFAGVARRLENLAGEQTTSGARLAMLRVEAGKARGRMSLLEEAERSARAAAARAREGKQQAALDDRTAALRARRR